MYGSSTKSGRISLYGSCVGVTTAIQLHHFLQKSFSPMAAAMCQALTSFYSDYNSKSLFISVSFFYEKNIVTQDYCVSTHDSFCSLGNYKFHIILIGTSHGQILQRLDKYQYIYQEIDCVYTLYQHRFFSSIVTSNGEVFNQLSCAVQHNLRWKGAEKTPSVSRKRLVRKKFKKHYLSSNQKLASTQTLDSAFLDRIRKVQNSKYESDLFKKIDCFNDGYGSVNSERVYFFFLIFWLFFHKNLVKVN